MERMRVSEAARERRRVREVRREEEDFERGKK